MNDFEYVYLSHYFVRFMTLLLFILVVQVAGFTGVGLLLWEILKLLRGTALNAQEGE